MYFNCSSHKSNCNTVVAFLKVQVKIIDFAIKAVEAAQLALNQHCSFKIAQLSGFDRCYKQDMFTGHSLLLNSLICDIKYKLHVWFLTWEKQGLYNCTGTHCCLMSDKCALCLGIKLFRMHESSKMSQEVEGNTHVVCNDIIRRLACETGAMQCVQSTLIRFLIHQIQSIWKLKCSFVFQMQLKHLKLMEAIFTLRCVFLMARRRNACFLWRIVSQWHLLKMQQSHSFGGKTRLFCFWNKRFSENHIWDWVRNDWMVNKLKNTSTVQVDRGLLIMWFEEHFSLGKIKCIHQSKSSFVIKAKSSMFGRLAWSS